MIPGWILFIIGMATTIYNIWKSGYSVSRELNKKVDRAEYDKDKDSMKVELGRKIEAKDITNVRETIMGTVDRANEISRMELKHLKETLEKHEFDHTTLNQSIKDIQGSVNSMAISMAVFASKVEDLTRKDHLQQ